MKNKFIEIYSWYGVVAVLIAYLILTVFIKDKYSDTGRMLFFLATFLNVTGSLGIMIDAYKSKNWQPVATNSIWIIISIVSFALMIAG